MAVDRATMGNKTEATMWKSIKNWIRNRCHKWVSILFGVTYRKNKQCLIFCSYSKLNPNTVRAWSKGSWKNLSLKELFALNLNWEALLFRFATVSMWPLNHPTSFCSLYWTTLYRWIFSKGVRSAPDFGIWGQIWMSLGKKYGKTFQITWRNWLVQEITLLFPFEYSQICLGVCYFWEEFWHSIAG